MPSNQHPNQAIRCFNIFAEYTRLERLDKGYPANEAKGYGIWLAKVVASRQRRSKDDGPPKAYRDRYEPEPRFRSLSGEGQTDRTFDHDIVDRMGETFYLHVFTPAIKEARERGEKYEQIRDSIRRDWKPA